MPAVDYGDIISRPQQAFDEAHGLSVKFYKRLKRDDDASKKEGRPIHVSKEYVRIQPLGDKTLVIDRPVKDEDKRRFPNRYAAFKADKDQDATEGQPLRDWPTLPENLAADWAELGVKTVEQLCAVAEGNFHMFGPQIREYQKKAKLYIEAAKSDAPLLVMQSEIDALKKQLAAEKAKHSQPTNAVPSPENVAQGPIVRKKA